MKPISLTRFLIEEQHAGFIIEQAGGAASTGRLRMLDVQPTGLHQRVPVFMGSKMEVETAVRYHQDFDAKNL